ncbi:MAG: hypothetical protein HC908_01560 [Calothrix sp. SM1_7_51]|nr:hypothetical protein [Calothrix sp. SM1_7_51]
MQAHKLKGKIDDAGNLVITDLVTMPPGDVEVIVLHSLEVVNDSTLPNTEVQSQKPKRKSKIRAFAGLFENAPDVPSDFNPDEARWSALKEKYSL